MSNERWSWTNAYAGEVFGAEPPHIRATREAAAAAGIPSWAVTPELGRFLTILARTTPGRLALEIGTLGGYSTLWLLDGLAPEGRISTFELNDAHADFAQAQFERHGVGHRIDVHRGRALDLLPSVAADLGPGSVDLVFIDADKASYPDYYRETAKLVAPGGLLLVDNIFGTSEAWIDETTHADIVATDRMNRLAAEDERFDTAGLFVRSGILVARRRTDD